MITTAIVGLLLAFGTAYLTKCIIKLVSLGWQWFRNKIKERLKRKGVDKEVVITKQAVQELVSKAAKEADSIKIADLDDLFEDNDIIAVDITDENVNLNQDDDPIEIWRAESVDRKLTDLMRQHDGMVVLEG